MHKYGNKPKQDVDSLPDWVGIPIGIIFLAILVWWVILVF